MKSSQLHGVRHALRRLLRSERGQGMVEYALIVSVVALGSLAALQFLGGSISDLFNRAGSQLSAGAAGVPGGGGTGAGGTPPPGGTPINGGNGGTPGGGGLPPAGTPGNNNNPVFNANPTDGPPGFTGAAVQGIFWGDPGDVPPATFPVQVTELGDTITVSGCRVHITTPTTFDFYGVWIREPQQSNNTDWQFVVNGINYEWACVAAPAFTLVSGSESGASFNSNWTGSPVGQAILGQPLSSSFDSDSNPWYNANTNTAPTPVNTNKPGVYDNNGTGWTTAANYFHPTNGTVWLCYWQGTANYSFGATTGMDNGCLAAAPPVPQPGTAGISAPANPTGGVTLTATAAGFTVPSGGGAISRYYYEWERDAVGTDTDCASATNFGNSDTDDHGSGDANGGTTDQYTSQSSQTNAYCYRVRVHAENAQGQGQDSPWSASFWVAATPTPAPGAPNVRLRDAGDDIAYINLTGSATNAAAPNAVDVRVELANGSYGTVDVSISFTSSGGGGTVTAGPLSGTPGNDVDFNNVNLSSLPDGTITVTATVTGVTAPAASDTDTAVKDTVAPTPTIDCPTGGSSNNTYVCTGTYTTGAGNNAPGNGSVFWDRTTFGTDFTTNATSNAGNWSSSQGLNNGSTYTVTITQTDAAGNAGTASDTITNA